MSTIKSIACTGGGFDLGMREASVLNLDQDMSERFRNEVKALPETEFFNDLNLDQIFNHFGEFPEADPARRAAVEEIFATPIPQTRQVKEIPDTIRGMKRWDLLRARDIEEAAAKRLEYREIAERLVSCGLLTDEDQPEAVEARGDEYNYLYNGDDSVVSDTDRIIAPLGPLYTRALYREQFKAAEDCVREAVAGLAAYGIVAKPPRFRWNYFTSQFKGRIGTSDRERRGEGSPTDVPEERVGMASEQYAYPVRDYPNEDRNSLYAVKKDIFTWLAKDVLNLDGADFINNKLRFGSVERKKPLDPVQDFFYRVAHEFEVGKRKERHVTVDRWQKIRKAFPESNPPTESVLYAELPNVFAPLLAILETGLCPLGFSKDQFYCFIVQCDKY